MKENRYIEFRVYSFKKRGDKFATDKLGFPVPEEKNPTKKGHVMITKQQAEMLNADSLITKIWYELDKENPENKSKEELNKK